MILAAFVSKRKNRELVSESESESFTNTNNQTSFSESTLLN